MIDFGPHVTGQLYKDTHTHHIDTKLPAHAQGKAGSGELIVGGGKGAVTAALDDALKAGGVAAHGGAGAEGAAPLLLSGLAGKGGQHLLTLRARLLAEKRVGEGGVGGDAGGRSRRSS